MLPAGKIAPGDPELIRVADDPADVVRIVSEAHDLNLGRENLTEMT
jgi:hypothetical protein